jgi:hypothetical protein
MPVVALCLAALGAERTDASPRIRTVEFRVRCDANLPACFHRAPEGNTAKVPLTRAW